MGKDTELETGEARETLLRSLRTEMKAPVVEAERAKLDEVRLNFIRMMLHGD